MIILLSSLLNINTLSHIKIIIYLKSLLLLILFSNKIINLNIHATTPVDPWNLRPVSRGLRLAPYYIKRLASHPRLLKHCYIPNTPLMDGVHSVRMQVMDIKLCYMDFLTGTYSVWVCQVYFSFWLKNLHEIPKLMSCLQYRYLKANCILGIKRR